MDAVVQNALPAAWKKRLALLGTQMELVRDTIRDIGNSLLPTRSEA